MFRATPTCQGSLGGSILVRLAASLAVGSGLFPTICAEGRVRAFLGCNSLGSARTVLTAVGAGQVGRCARDAAR